MAFCFWSFLYTLCNVAPLYNPRLKPFVVFPGIPFRLLFCFDVIIPQSLFLGLLYGSVLGAIVFVITMCQGIYRFFQAHGVYDFTLLPILDIPFLLALIALVWIFW